MVEIPIETPGFYRKIVFISLLLKNYPEFTKSIKYLSTFGEMEAPGTSHQGRNFIVESAMEAPGFSTKIIGFYSS